MEIQKTCILGLTSKEVKDRINENKVNGNYNVKTKSIGQIIFTNVFTLFNLVNTLLALGVFLVHSYKNMLFMGVVIWNIFIGVFQEIRSKRIIDKLSILSTPHALAIRDGNITKIKIDEIVIDDVLINKSGFQICADGIVLEGECEVNESLLTGESEPIYKKEGDTILSGSFLTSGEVKSKVIHVGKDNYVNSITGKAKYLKKPNSEINSSIKAIVKIVSICLIPVTALLFYNQITMKDNTLSQAVVSTVAAVIGMIPSGLVLLTSMVLAVSVVRLSQKNTLVQELFCIETLARVDVLCLDKTGTITEGSMNVEQLDIVDENYSTVNIKHILEVYTNELSDDNPTFCALKSYANSQVLPIDIKEEELNFIQSYDVCAKEAFSSDKKWGGITLEKYGTFIIGAMEYVMDNPSIEIKTIVNDYSKQGLRVLVIAHSDNEISGKLLPENIKVIAVMAITDKIREEAFDTIAYFKKQGVMVKVISGDNPDTVSYIAKKSGIKDADKFIDASKLTNEELYDVVEDYTIFGRVRPDQKLVIIKALKEKKHVVAMTGDGVNDVLALKEADCSIAMQSGSDAARNVSQLVLMDSNFSSMPYIVAEGRRTINNMQRSAALYLTKTIYSTALAVLFVFINIKFPFIPIQLTLIGALSIGIPSFILALEPNANRVKGRFLVNVLRMAIPGGVVVFTNIVLAIVFGWITNASNVQISTMAAYGLAMAAAVELAKLCRPYNTIRRIMCIFLVSVFVGASIIFGNFFGFALPNIIQLIFLAALFVFSFILFKTLEVFVERIMGSTPNIYHTQLAYSQGNRVLIVNDDVEKKDYYDVTALLKGVKILNCDSVVFIKTPQNDGDIRVESEDEITAETLAIMAMYHVVKVLKVKRHSDNNKDISIKVEVDNINEPILVNINRNKSMATLKFQEEEFKFKVHLLKKFKLTM